MGRVSLQTGSASKSTKKSKTASVDLPGANDVQSASLTTKGLKRCSQDAVEIGLLQYCMDGSVYSQRFAAGNSKMIGTVISHFCAMSWRF